MAKLPQPFKMIKEKLINTSIKTPLCIRFEHKNCTNISIIIAIIKY